MGTPYLCELRLVSFSFAPKGWAQANGQIQAISQNQAIFALLGTTYGGNGQTTFGLPNLQGRVAMHFGNGFTQGQLGGEATHTLAVSELPAHNHTASAVNVAADQNKPNNHLFANTAGATTVYGASPGTTLLPATVSNAGSSQPHENEQPYLVMNWIIALQGIFPSRN